MTLELFERQLSDHQTVLSSLNKMADSILCAADEMVAAFRGGKKILACGNGGSAADSQHFTAELLGRFEMERAAWPAIALTTDTSILTALGNDYAFVTIFARQVEALGNPGDILLCISTSGNSANIIKAAELARSKGVKTIGLLGRGGGTLDKMVDIGVIVESDVTARIQEAHAFILHFWCRIIERRLT